MYIHLTLICESRSTVHQDSHKCQVDTYVTGLARFKCFQQELSAIFTQKEFWDCSTLFTPYSLVSDFCVKMSSTPISLTASFSERMISKIHEVKELYDGTLNAVVNYAFSTLDLDTSNNEVFTYTKALQQEDTSQFVKAMRKEIEDHES